MSDFFKIDTRPGKRGVTEIYPKFIVGKPNDLMIRGSDFYAIWMEERGLWSTDEQDVIRTIDRELRTYADEYQKTHDNGFHVLYMWDAESGMIDNWHKYCQRQMRDNFHPLDEVLIFSNTPVKKESYASKRLPYPLEPGSINAYDELMGVLYSPEEREKLEWAIGAVVNGASKEVQKFIVLYGDPGSGKSTVLNIVQKLFEGYCGVFDSRALGSSSNAFALEAFKSNPLVSIDDINSIIKGAKTSGTLKAAFDNAGVEQGEIDELSHGIDNIDWLFPEDHLLDTTPRIIDKPDDWVSVVMGGVKHIPFSRFKSMFADLTPEDARAKGYVKGNYKIEEVFGLLRRSTGPTTVYKKQKLDRDDVSDITSFDVVSWLHNEMRYKLNRELALAYILGDGRQAASEDKIDENCIRPIFNDADLFTIKVQVTTTGLSKVEDKYKAFIKQVIRSRKEYRGSGTPVMFTTEDALTEMLLLEDGMGRPLYADEAALARKLRVSKIVTVPEMDGRKGAKGGDLAAVIVNLSDYTVGADKGGAVSMFDDFDIDYNAMKYLIEARCSGALTTPYSAMAIEWAA